MFRRFVTKIGRGVGLLMVAAPMFAQPDETSALLHRVGQLHQQGRFAEAIPVAERLLGVWERSPKPEPIGIAISLNILADLHQGQGDNLRAEPLYRRALALKEATLGPDHGSTAITVNNLAAVYESQGDFARAEPLYRRALAIKEKNVGPDHPSLAVTLNGLGSLHQRQGRYVLAEPLFRRALAICERSLGRDHPETATTLNNLALLYRLRGDHAQAEPLYRRALAISEHNPGPDHPSTATSLNNLAALYRSQGDFTRAEPLFRRALAIRERSLGREHHDTAASLNNLAALHESKGEHAKAEPLYRRALAICEGSLGRDHPDTAAALTNLGLLQWTMQDHAGALDSLSLAAQAQEINLERNLSVGTEAQRLAFVRQLDGSTGALLTFASAQPSVPARRLALETVLRRKGRVLDVLADELGTLRTRLNADGRGLLDQLAQARAALVAMALRGPAGDDVEARRAERSRLEGVEAGLVQRLSESSAEFRSRVDLVTLARVQAALPAGAVLLEYVRFEPLRLRARTEAERWGKPRYGAFVLGRSGEPAWVDLGLAAPIEAALLQWRRLLSLGKQRDAAQPLAHQLDGLLLGPLPPHVRNAPTLLVSPDAALHLLPWPALEGRDGGLLRERTTVSLLDSGRDLLRLTRPAPVPQPSLVLANPDYGLTPAVEQSCRDLARGRPAAGSHWCPLPGTHREATRIQKVLGLRDDQVLEGVQASKASLLQVRSPRVLHLATHGAFSEESPAAAGSRGLVHKAPDNNPPSEFPGVQNPLLRSRLVLAGANRPGSAAESTVTALELSHLDLRGTQLVTLSACETGLGETLTGEGIFGLRRALTLAGAQAQLFSLWKVDDDATATLMGRFYEQLTAGKGRAEALREAQRAVAKTQPDPFYWAAFVLAGNPGPVAAQSAR